MSGSVLLLRRWVVERAFAWMARFPRLAREFESLTSTLAGLHTVPFIILLLRRAADFAHVRNTLTGTVSPRHPPQNLARLLSVK